MAKENKTQYAILGMLSIAPMSGYDIRATIKKSTANFWAESDGQLYPALAMLTKQGLVVCAAAKDCGARGKKLYCLTQQGRQALQTWLELPPENQSIRNELLLKLFFGANLSSSMNQERLALYRYQLKIQLNDLLMTQQDLQRRFPDSTHLPYWLMSLRYGIRLTEAKLAWCETEIEHLKRLEQ